ncbi:MAG: Bro-N domain-containing protein [Treponema sp.]|jgi:prophage antirepressor-like protein|nr:Bro-N domain-containing protein [Treponema sp.]
MSINKTVEWSNNHITPFTYEGHSVRTVLIDDVPWFVAKDVCDILGIKNSRDTLAKLLPETEKGVETIYTPGGKQEVLIVNEPGLYRLIFWSRKVEAETFKTWVFTCVLPRIRRTGLYASPDIVGLPEYDVLGALLGAIKNQAVIMESFTQELKILWRQNTSKAIEGKESDVWITTTELSEVYGKSRATCLSHTRALGWPMRIARLKTGSLTYEFLLSGLPERLQIAWQERQGPQDD